MTLVKVAVGLVLVVSVALTTIQMRRERREIRSYSKKPGEVRRPAVDDGETERSPRRQGPW
jgi:hypothetical protein